MMKSRRGSTQELYIKTWHDLLEDEGSCEFLTCFELIQAGCESLLYIQAASTHQA